MQNNQSTIADRGTCPRCGFTSAALGSGGLCPRCLWTSSLLRDDPDPLLAESSVGAAPSQTHLSPARSIPGCELLEEIGRGGMGVVYKARQTALNRVVAVKVLAGGPFASAEFAHRFRAEAETAARLRHPNIVAIHDISEMDGLAFFIMDFVEGANLAERARHEPFLPREAAACVETLARAVAHAHAHGVLHRDLKPSNVLLDFLGQPHITDFGLAKQFGTVSQPSTQGTQLTTTGQALGSPGYAAPEQIRLGQADARSDIYGLGATLYHLLTGRPPFAAATPIETLRAAQEHEPVRPGGLNPAVSRDLETICLKCLEKDPAKRYATAQELADELERFLNDEPIHARPVTRAEHAWRWCRRKPALAASIFLLLLLLLVLGVGGPLVAWRFAEQRARAEAERARAEAESIQARHSTYAAEMLLAQQALERDNLGWARELIEKYRPTGNSEIGNLRSESSTVRNPQSALRVPDDPRGWEWHFLAEQTRGDEFATLRGHSNTVTAVTFSPDGKWLVSAANDGMAQVWNLTTRQIESSLPHSRGHTLWAAAFSPDGKILATATGSENFVTCWRVPEFEFLHTLPISTTNLHRHHGLVFSPDGQWLVSAGNLGVCLWNLTTNGPAIHFPAQLSLNLPVALAFAPDGSSMVFGVEHGTMAVVDLRIRQIVRRRMMHPNSQLAGLAFTPDGRRLLSGSWDGIRVWDTTTFTELAHYTNHVQFPLALSPDGRTLAAAGWTDRRIHLLDATAASEEPRVILRGHWNSMYALAWAPDGRMLASGGRDNTVKLWSAQPADTPMVERKYPFRLDEATVPDQRLVLSPDGLWLATAYTNQTFSLWHTPTLTEAARITSPFEYLESLAISSGAGWLALGGADGVLKLAEWKPYRVVLSTNLADGPVKRLLFSPEGDRLAIHTGNKDGIRIRSVPDLELIASVPGRDYPVTMCFSADASKLAIGWSNGEASIFDLDTQRIQAVMRGHLQQVRGVALSRDATRLATAALDSTVRVWDTATGRELHAFDGLFEPFGSVAFSPDETRLLAGTGSGIMHVWNLATRQQVLLAKKHKTPPMHLRFLPDQTTLLTVSHEEFRLWRAAQKSQP